MEEQEAMLLKIGRAGGESRNRRAKSLIKKGSLNVKLVKITQVMHEEAFKKLYISLFLS